MNPKKVDEWMEAGMRIKTNQISYQTPADMEAIEEAVRRQQYDGIPRHIYNDGRIMKWDWELLDGEQG